MARRAQYEEEVDEIEWMELFAIRAGAVAIGAIGFALLLALLTYASSDPSWNTATTQNTTENWLGLLGAYTSDLFLQSLGFAAFLIPLAFFRWSVSLWRDLEHPEWQWPSLWLMLACTAWAASLALLPFRSEWLPSGQYGGGVGFLLGQSFLHSLTPWLGKVAAIVTLAAVFLTGAIVATMGAFRLTPDHFLEIVPDAFARVKDYVLSFFDREHDYAFEAEVEQYDDEAEEGEEEESRPARKARRQIKIREQEEKKPKRGKKKVQPELEFNEGEFVMPPTDLLEEVIEPKGKTVSRDALENNARVLLNVLAEFGVRGEIVEIHPGPVVTLYELEPAPGIKSARVIGLAEDIARSMSAVSVRVAVVPGRNVIGIELPNARREIVYMRALLENGVYEDHPARLALILGKDIGGHPVIADLAKMPHLLVAGTTGSGKSVAINTMILSLLYRLDPAQCRMIMIDPKMLELSVYEGIPHLLAPVVTEPKKAIVALKWAVREMENRYRSMSKLGVRNIDGYNVRIAEARENGEQLTRRIQTGFDPDTGKPLYEEEPMDMNDLPYIVLIVDEFADLMLVAGKEIEGAIQRLAQMARAAGIHLIMATQRPSVDVITGTIKANFPTRISFQVTSKIDSRTILGEGGAEQLLGQGDMLYMAAGGRITRVHGPFVRDDEVERVVEYLREQGAPEYLDEVTEDEEENALLDGDEEGEEKSNDPMFDEAVDVIAREGKASTSFLQRHLNIGYQRAARIIDQMEREGMISSANHVGKREVLLRKTG